MGSSFFIKFLNICVKNYYLILSYTSPIIKHILWLPGNRSAPRKGGAAAYETILMLGNETSQVILSLSLMLFAGFLVTRGHKAPEAAQCDRLYFLLGILLGPYLLDAVPVGWLPEWALSMISPWPISPFGVGRYFKIATLKKRRGTLIITVLEALLAMAAITLPL